MNQCALCGEYSEALLCVQTWALTDDGIDDEFRVCDECIPEIVNDDDYDVVIIERGGCEE